MKNHSTSRMACPNKACDAHGRRGAGNIAMHGYSKVKWGRRRRYRCTACGRTFGATTGTAYKRLQHPKRKFDRVASLSVEGVSEAAISRIEGLSWNTVSRWLELAAALARQFNATKLRGFALEELQLDELSTFLGNRNQQSWVFAGIEVSSRLWPATLVGPRSWRNTKSFVRSIADSSEWAPFPLITSDGMKFYGSAIQLTFGVACVHAQVIKKIKQNHVVKVGTKRVSRMLEGHLELLRFHYNFCRPNSALKFGSVTRTPAMQAGLASRGLTFRDLFVPQVVRARFVLLRSRAEAYHGSVRAMKCAA